MSTHNVGYDGYTVYTPAKDRDPDTWALYDSEITLISNSLGRVFLDFTNITLEGVVSKVELKINVVQGSYYRADVNALPTEASNYVEGMELSTLHNDIYTGTYLATMEIPINGWVTTDLGATAVSLINSQQTWFSVGITSPSVNFSAMEDTGNGAQLILTYDTGKKAEVSAIGRIANRRYRGF